MPRISFAQISYRKRAVAETVRVGYTQFIYLEKGSIGVRWETGDEIVLEKGNFCILPPNIQYTVQQNDNDAQISVNFAFFLDEGRVELVDESDVAFEHPDNVRYVKNECLYVPLSGTMSPGDTCYNELTKIVTYYDGLEEYSNVSVAAQTLQFFVSLAHEYVSRLKGRRDDEKGRAAAYCDRIDEYLQKNYAQTVTMPIISRMMGLHENYLSALYKKMRGCTVMEQLTNIRIRQAKVLLVQNKHSVKEVAALVGYKDVAYFNKVFKKHESVTPGKYFNRLYDERLYSYSTIDD